MLSVAMIGAGRIGRIHARNIAAHPGARLAGVADVDAVAAAQLAESCGARALSIDEAFAADAVVIGSPTPTHADYIERAAAAGCAIFCEKPIDLDSERVRACLAVVRRAGVPLMVGFNRRFDPHFAALKRRMDAGEIGALEMLTIVSRDPAPPPLSYIATSGGLFRDCMIHDLDMARFLLAEEPVELHAAASCLVDPAIGAAGDVDTAVADTADRERQAVPDLQLAPRDLRLRPAHRGAWCDGSAACRQRHRDDRRTGERRRVRHRPGAAVLPGTLCRGVSPGTRCVRNRGDCRPRRCSRMATMA